MIRNVKILKICFLLIAFFVTFNCFSQKSALKPYIDFLQCQNTSAVDYVFELFEKYDIIILGERDHRDMSQYQFVSEIISDRRFIQNVGHIFTEIGATNQTERANNILGSEYESYLDFEKDLMELYRDLSSSYIWEKYNYWYLLSAIYRINTSLNDNQNLTLHFTDINFDWNNYFDINAYTDIYSRDSIMGCNFINEFDKILQNQDELRKKALVIFNSRHSFRDHSKATWRKSAASVLFEHYPERVANVMINTTNFTDVIDGPDYLIEQGQWDAAFKHVGNPRIGFDMIDSPFGEAILEYYDSPHEIRYKDVFTGFIFYKPISEWILMTGIPGFVDEDFKSEYIRRYKLQFPNAEVRNILRFDIPYCNTLKIRDNYEGNDLSREQVEKWINYWLE